MKIQLISLLLTINTKEKLTQISISYHILMWIELNLKFLTAYQKLFLVIKQNQNIQLFMELD